MAKIVPYEMENKQSVLQEYEILKGLHHERIMALHEAYITPRYLVLIAEHCTGKEILYHLVDRFAEGTNEGERGWTDRQTQGMLAPGGEGNQVTQSGRQEGELR